MFFEYDIKHELFNVIETGIVTDWKKSTDFFYTPEAVVNEMLGQVLQPLGGQFDMLEPSAGQGHLLDLFKANFPNADITAVEINPMHCQKLKNKGYDPINDDFLNVEVSTIFELVLMNPPFTYEMEHIQHAYKFLVDDGQLITIASGGILDKKY